MQTVGESEHCLSKVRYLVIYSSRVSSYLMSNIVEWLKFIPGIWTKVCVGMCIGGTELCKFISHETLHSYMRH